MALKAPAAGGATLKPSSRAAWVHNFNTTAATTALFQTLPGTSFTVNTAKPSADAALLTAGAEYKFGYGWSVLGKLDGEFSKATTVYAGTGDQEGVGRLSPPPRRPDAHRARDRAGHSAARIIA